MDMEFFSSNVMGSAFVKGKRSKRLRPWFNSAENQLALWSCSDSTLEDEHDSEDDEIAAHSLMLLSHGSSPNHVRSPSPTTNLSKRVTKKPKEFHSADSSPYLGEKRSSYSCKTCSKAFLSFQALGGHRASCGHTNTTTAESHEKRNEKTKVHECSVCFRVFTSGQALGGHKRTHSTAPPPTHSFSIENEERAELDLNMPAPLDETEDDSSAALPCSTAVRSHYSEYKLSPPFWWMNSNGKRFGGAADEAESKVPLGQDLRFNQDLFMVATVN